MPEKKLSHRSPIPSFHLRIRFLDPTSWIFSMLNFAEERKGLVVSKLRSLRWVTAFVGVGNVILVVLGSFISVSGLVLCSGDVTLTFVIVPLVAGVRIFCTVGAGFAQVATAAMIVNYSAETSAAVDAVTRQERRLRYRRWLWWTRFGMGVTASQFAGALYLTFVLVKNFSYDGKSKKCFLGWDAETRGREWISMICFAIVAWFVVIIQCFTGTDVLRWRSFYATHDTAWRAHYLEVFDHGIREALCCLGRVKYLSVLEEDEVYSVAHLLGDLVAYRATGTGHLEFLAGLALLQSHGQSPHLNPELVEQPQTRIWEAAPHHQFAEAAYTGPLLDFGRNPVLFPCAWLYRQGILSPWTRNRRPVLEGDNWWRGHAAAFLKYVNLPPDALRRGRVSQTKREAAYFIVVLHHSRSVVIAVRGTETPEDLLTDVLCRECALTENDLDGLINSDHVAVGVKEKVLSSFPHYGHSGIVECARELFMQIDGTPEIKDGHPSETAGFLSSLMGVGQECHGYKICIVGHSLGGSVATLIGLRLYRHYSNLHVYSFGTLPCVDLIIAEACSSFVTCIVYNDEFSARLSVSSIIRLRTAAITALSDDSTTDSDIIRKIARQILQANNHQQIKESHSSDTSLDLDASKVENMHPCKSNFKHTVKGGRFLCAHAVSCMINMPAKCNCSPQTRGCCVVSSDAALNLDRGSSTFAAKADESIQEFCSREVETSSIKNSSLDDERKGYNEFNHTDATENAYSSNFERSRNQISFEDHRSQGASNFSSLTVDNPPEMFLPGLIIHIVQDDRSFLPSWKNWRSQDKKRGYRAFVANREQFKDIVVTPYMFLDHLPWRCHYAMQRVLEYQKDEHHPTDNSLNV